MIPLAVKDSTGWGGPGGGRGPSWPPEAFLPFLRLVYLLFVLAALPGCAAPKPATGPAGGQVVFTPRQPPRHAKPSTSGFASADAKNIHDFLVKYQTVITGEDEKAILRLYGDGARMVPYLVENRRVLTKKELESRLGYITKMQHKARMRLAFREPMDITVSGETGQVRALADMRWQEHGQPRQVVLDCFFSLERVDYIWKIKQSHQEVAAPGQTVPGQGAKPAVRPESRPDQNREDRTPPDGAPRPIIPLDRPS